MQLLWVYVYKPTLETVTDAVTLHERVWPADLDFVSRRAHAVDGGAVWARPVPPLPRDERPAPLVQ